MHTIRRLSITACILALLVLPLAPLAALVTDDAPDGADAQWEWRGMRAGLWQIGCAFGTCGVPVDPRAMVAVVIKVFMGILGLIFLIYVLYAGFTWMTARGDEGKVEQAKSTLTTGIIGMLIIFAAYAIARFVLVAAACATDVYGSWCVFLQRF